MVLLAQHVDEAEIDKLDVMFLDQVKHFCGGHRTTSTVGGETFLQRPCHGFKARPDKHLGRMDPLAASLSHHGWAIIPMICTKIKQMNEATPAGERNPAHSWLVRIRHHSSMPFGWYVRYRCQTSAT
jgi:hypothetical protein